MITGKYTGLQVDTQGYRGIHRITSGYTRLQVATQDYI